MKKVSFYILLMALLLAYSCNKESLHNTLTPTETDEAQVYVDKAISMLELEDTELAFQAKIEKEDADLDRQKGGPRLVHVPAGSHNELQAAVDRVRIGGMIVLETGEHIEDNTVKITKRIKILGEPGAILRFDTEPDLDDTPPAVLDPGLFLEGANGVIIENINFRNVNDLAGVAILCYNSNFTRIRKNSIEGHLFGIVQQYADFSRIHDNELITGGEWCMLNVNGKHARIYSNTTGPIFMGDRGGLIFRNNFNNGNVIGLLLCTPRLPPAYIQLPDGTLGSAERSAYRWLVVNNQAQDHLWGYLVVDGAHDNILVNNRASGSILADIEMAGPTERFGFPAPTSYNNLVISTAYPETTIKICGDNNRAISGVLIDTNEFPCD